MIGQFESYKFRVYDIELDFVALTAIIEIYFSNGYIFKISMGTPAETCTSQSVYISNPDNSTQDWISQSAHGNMTYQMALCNHITYEGANSLIALYI